MRRICILGASGRLGRVLTQQALDRGHQVKALIRQPDKFPIRHPHLEIIQGSPQGALRNSMTFCEAVFNVLNISRTSDFPWSPLRTPERFLSETMRRLIPMMEAEDVSKLVLCSAWGVHETKRDLPFWFRWVIDNSNVGVAYRDHERQEDIISESRHINWTIVRPVGLTNSKRICKPVISHNNQPKPGLLISRASVAAFMLDAWEQKHLYQKRVTISTKGF
ncbi:MAG: NAD(P)H-binding protein [Bacteroidota bacterium]